MVSAVPVIEEDRGLPSPRRACWRSRSRSVAMAASNCSRLGCRTTNGWAPGRQSRSTLATLWASCWRSAAPAGPGRRRCCYHQRVPPRPAVGSDPPAPLACRATTPCPVQRPHNPAVHDLASMRRPPRPAKRGPADRDSWLGVPGRELFRAVWTQYGRASVEVRAGIPPLTEDPCAAARAPETVLAVRLPGMWRQDAGRHQRGARRRGRCTDPDARRADAAAPGVDAGSADAVRVTVTWAAANHSRPWPGTRRPGWR
jgi:hypothetical protein